MKKIFYTLFICCMSLSLSAQEISVKSFRQLPNDLTARVNPVKNDNAQSCALVKVVTTERGFEFDPDGLGICGNVDESHAAEIWLWVPPGARRITIRHKDLGILRNYEYPVPIESACTYEMVLVTGKIEVVVKQQNRENWLALTVNPPEAVAKIDGEIVVLKNGSISKIYAVGTHTYEVFCDMYHPQRGTFSISPDETSEVQVKLKPNYGWLKVTSTPESDAVVYVNSKQVGVTPYKSEKMASGTYTVQVVKDMYQDVSRQVTITDEKTAEVNLELPANFAEPTIVCKDADAEIWINNEKMGIGKWSGRLPAGDYRFESRKTSHRPMQQSLTLVNGNKPNIILQAPIPVYGSLNVNSEPFGADILLDGKKIGTTPKIVNNVLVGSYRLTVEKNGYKSLSETVIVNEDKITERTLELQPIGGERNTTPETSKPVSKKPSHPCMPVFFTLNGAYLPAPQWSGGFSIGQVKRWGWYLTAMTNFRYKGMGRSLKDGEIYDLTGKTSTTRISVTAGAVFRTCKPLSVRLGAGFGYRAQNCETVNDGWYSIPYRTYMGADVELGLLWHIKSFLLTTDVTTTNFKYVEFKLGLGFCMDPNKK